MKKITHFLSKLIYIILLIAIFIIIYIIIFSKINNLSIEDSLNYYKYLIYDIFNTDYTIGYDPNILNNTATYTSDNISIHTVKNNYYYNQLDEYGKIIYNSIANNIENMKKNNFIIDFSTKFNSLLNEPSGQYKLNKSFQSALDAFSYDNPEYFYINISNVSLSIKHSTFGIKTKYYVSIVPTNGKSYLYDKYALSLDSLNNDILAVENAKNKILNSITATTDYDKLLAVHDILINSIDYTSTDSNNDYNIYGALINKKVVCEGYSKAFKYIVDSLGIDCILVCGSAINSDNSNSDGELHMWNYVLLNNKWYGIDVTWDDPIIINSKKKILRHTYFCKGYKAFNESHFPNGKITDSGMMFTLPTLSNTNYK